MQGMKPLGPVPDAQENTVSLMVIWSRLLAPHLAHQIQGKSMLFHLAIHLHWFNQNQAYTRLSSSVKPASKNLCSQRELHTAHSIYVTL